MQTQIPRLEFFEDEHIYLYGGQQVPSVTQILEPYTGLEWVDQATLEAAQAFGTHVHQACHLYNIGQLDYDELAGDDDNQGVRAYLDGWIKFCQESGFVSLEAERQVFHERLRYAGTVDTVGLFPHKRKRVQIDIKTGASMPKTVGPQTAAYNEARGERIPRYCCLLTPGGYSLNPLTDPGDFAIFKAALTLHRWRN